jgi:hypothetical protein
MPHHLSQFSLVMFCKVERRVEQAQVAFSAQQVLDT